MSLVVANWKMNPQSAAEAKEIYSGTRRAAIKYKKVTTVVCPPAIYLQEFSRLKSKGVYLGAQNVFYEESGSYTGEISPYQVAGFGATHVIVGHSERRALGETDEVVNKKVLALHGAKLTAIICIGEAARDANGDYFALIRQELKTALKNVSKKNLLKNVVIAYEPIWAIGKSDADAIKGSDMHEMSLFIRKVLMEIYKDKKIFSVPILYGGSVTPANAEEIYLGGEVDGFLVGRASLSVPDFAAIIKIVHDAKRA